jgi:hypothetical protein
MNTYEKTDEEKSQLGKETGTKFDAGKSRWDLIPADVVLEVSQQFETFKGLYEKESKIDDYYGKMLFHYSNGMECAFNFWNMSDAVPFSAAKSKPLVFGIVSYIHLLDLALIAGDAAQLKLRDKIYEMSVPETSALYLMPYRVLNYIGDIYLYGCNKYDENNWRKGMPWGKIFAAFCRHSGQWFGGEDMDQESGMHHLGHALWQLFGLRWYEQYAPSFDDRWENKIVEKKKPLLESVTTTKMAS